MISGLVNLLTPAYNCAPFINKLLDSVLSQTYPTIEMFIIDDGSTDNTAEVIKSYIPKFAKRGYVLKYIYQNNQGQSYAINNGLKLLNGEFLLWPDSDDWYKEKYSIEKIISKLQETDDTVGIARCRYERIEENTNKIITTTTFPQTYHIDNIFSDAIYNKNGFFWEPGGYAIKLSLIDKLIPNREIFTSRDTGQNIQILLPYFYNTKCITIHDTLFCYLVRSMSHSRGTYSELSRYEKRECAHLQNFISTISSLNLNSADYSTINIVLSIRYYRKIFHKSLSNHNYECSHRYYKKLNALHYKFSKRDRLKYMLLFVIHLFWK